jgi:hypothetical protein
VTDSFPWSKDPASGYWIAQAADLGGRAVGGQSPLRTIEGWLGTQIVVEGCAGGAGRYANAAW